MVEKRGRPKAPLPDNIQIQRMRALAALAGDPDCVTQIYLLRRLRLLTEPQYFAAERVADIYRRWHKLAAERPNPKSASLEFTTANGSGQELDPEWVEDTRALWDRLEECFDHRRKEERDAVVRLCVHNQAITRQELHDTVYRVLNRVSVEFDLGGELPEVREKEERRLAAAERKRKSRAEKAKDGTYAYVAPGATPVASHRHEPGSPGERDHAALVRMLEERQAKREAAAAS